MKLFLIEIEKGFHKVYLYEPLRKHEINDRKRKGWKIIK